MVDSQANSAQVPTISVQQPTEPNAPALRQAGLLPRSSPRVPEARLTAISPSEPSPEDSIIQPGAPVYELPEQLEGQLEKIKLIGGGAYGNVYQGEWTVPGKDPIPVAIKCIREAFLEDEDDVEAKKARFERRIKRETVIWQTATHKNILPFYGYQIVDQEPRLVSPWCKNGSLTSYIYDHPEMTDVDKLKLLSDAAQGLAYLHSLSPPIIHGDIKPDNVIITDEKTGTLSDFGISRVMTALGTHTGLTTSGQSAGTAGYQAKELYDENSTPTAKSDVYAFGGLILAVMSGKAPFYSKTIAAAIIVAIFGNETALPRDHHLLPENDALWDLLRRCWRPSPSERPSMAQIVEELETQIRLRAK